MKKGWAEAFNTKRMASVPAACSVRLKAFFSLKRIDE